MKIYKHIIHTYIIPYLQKYKIKVKRPLDAFDCVFCNAKKSAKILPGSYNYDCFNCKPKNGAKYYTLIDVVIKLENLIKFSEEAIYQKIRKLFDIKIITKKDGEDLDTFLDFYVENKFDLVPCGYKCPFCYGKGIKEGKKCKTCEGTGNYGKNCIEKEWTTKTHTEKSEWLQWLALGQNFGVKTGQKSNITVIDVDQKPIPDIIKKYMGKTLMQETPKGFHLFYKYDKDFPKTRIDEYKIDIENDGGQVVIFPSKTSNKERKMILSPIIQIPQELKKLLLQKTTVPRKTQSEQLTEEIQTESFKINLFQEGSRNSSLIKIGGVLRKGLNIRQTEFVLNTLNKHNKNPLPVQEVRAMLRKLDHYTQSDNEELSHQVLEYVKQVEESNRNEIAMAVVGTNRGEDKKRIDKVLSVLIEEGYLIKRGARYGIINKIDWQEEWVHLGSPLDFKMPYFSHIMNFNKGDLILIGSKNANGKTHISMNIIKKLYEQGLKPGYLSLESGSRWTKIAKQLGLKEGDFKFKEIADATKWDFGNQEVVVLDWLCPSNYAEVDKLLQHFTKKIQKTQTTLILFMQLRDNEEWLSKDLVKQFPAFACRYVYDNTGDGEYGKFIVDKARDPKIKTSYIEIPCHYDWSTKELERVEDYQKSQEELLKKRKENDRKRN